MPIFTNAILQRRFDNAYVDFQKSLAHMPAQWVVDQEARLFEDLELGIRCGKDFWKVSAEAGVLVLRWSGTGRKKPMTQEKHVSSLITY